MTDAELERLRRHGFGVAYRMLGSVADAEDIAQEAMVRHDRTEESLDAPVAWVTTRKNRLRGTFTTERVTLNGQPGRLLRDRDGPAVDVMSIDVVNGRIPTVRITRNPEKLAHL